MAFEKSPLTWLVERFENGTAILKGDGQKLVVPRVMIPENVREGDILSAEFYLLKDEAKRRQNLAKSILEEILGKE